MRESQKSSEFPVDWTWPRVGVAVLIGLLGACGVWILGPIVGMLFNAQRVAESYLPVAVLLCMLAILLLVNPLLGRLAGRGGMLSRGQLAIIFGMLLVSCAVSNMMNTLPYALAKAPIEINRKPQLVKVYGESGMHPDLFPGKVQTNLTQAQRDGKQPIPRVSSEELQACRQFITTREDDQPIPWAAWKGPLWTWGTFLALFFLMSVGLALVVMPEWRHNERLAFPLLSLEQTLIESPQPGKLIGPLFRGKGFWIAAATVFLLHWLVGMNKYHPLGIPAIPLDWDIASLFMEGPLRFTPSHFRWARLFFCLIGVTYFMSSRVSFSIWFFVLLYGGYYIVGRAYMPPFNKNVFMDQRFGAMVMLAITILWLGRRHWLAVGRCMIRPLRNPAEFRDRWAGWMFVAGTAGILLWMRYVGNVQWYWASFYTAIGFMAMLLISRLVAETGMPFIRLQLFYELPIVKILGQHLVKLKAASLIQPAAIFFSTVTIMIHFVSSRVSSATMSLHGVQLDERLTPRRQLGMAGILWGVLVVGILVSGVVHLYINYSHAQTLNGQYQPINNQWAGLKLFDIAHKDLNRFVSSDALRFDIEEFQRPEHFHGGFGHIIAGALVVLVLFWLCQRSPLWPLHPIGMVMADTIYGNVAYPSIFLGWLAKVLIVRYGGARLYHNAKPIFLGLIVGEALAAAYWGIEPAIHYYLTGQYEAYMVVR